MIRTYPLEIPFRGQRAYLHGTDLHQAIIAALADDLPPGHLSLTFHSLLKQQPDLVCSTESLRHLHQEPAFRGEVRFGSGGQVLHAVLLESSRPVTQRKDCNENEVAAAAVVDAATKSATLQDSRVGNAIEQVVFLNKRLHLQLLPHLSPTWLFARLDLTAPLPKAFPGGIAIVLKQVLGDRFTRSDIIAGGTRIGSISFSTPQ